jgi:ketosteroid isomerase-like protein
MDRNTAAVVGELEALDGRRLAATLAKDRSTLESLLAEDMRYVHSSGTDEDRATYVERACNGHYDYQGFTSLRRDWRLHGDVALCNGDIRIEVKVQGTPKTIHSRYLQVWVRGAKGWQMASWQSTPLPAPAA